VVAIAVAVMRDLFATVMLFGIYSLLTAGIFVSLDAVDVAFTEAAVGAGISTILILSTLALMPREEKKPTHSFFLPVLVVLITGAALVYGTLDMPAFSDPQAPVHQHVAPRYLDRAEQETGVPNIVTAVLASYRGYDTMGEVTVIFTAGIAVLLLLSAFRHDKDEAGNLNDLSHHPVLMYVARLMIPFILLFALYVQFHGDYGPGGGFQAGVIFAAGFILYGLVVGIDKTRQMFSEPILRWLMASGLLLYIGVGVATLLLGGEFLNYNVLATDPVKGQHWGIFLVELGVGITVTATMISLFLAFSEVRRSE
jgi:multicomponent Na+:H+ antiporter subunit B